ncbi:MAG: hypothetical protein JWR24_5363 [Actinoallomurus sp.]|nr:hypothetical protein [Actinoallomurus sp.]
MARLTAIPSQLRGGPFRRADGLRLGLTDKHLRGRWFRRIFYDVYAPAEIPDSLALRCAAARLLLPDHAVFCGVTAARLYRLPVPEDERVHVALPAGTPTPSEVRGLAVHRYAIGPAEYWRPDAVGEQVIRPERLFLELAAELSRLDLIIAGDQLLRLGWTTAAELDTYLKGCFRRRGRRRAREAVPLLEARSDSPPETRLRMLLVDNGFPRPVANIDVHDQRGIWIGRPDLAYPDRKIALDYEGRHHQEVARQYHEDIGRDDQFVLAGWIHLKYDARTLFRRPESILDDVHTALRQRDR